MLAAAQIPGPLVAYPRLNEVLSDATYINYTDLDQSLNMLLPNAHQRALQLEGLGRTFKQPAEPPAVAPLALASATDWDELLAQITQLGVRVTPPQQSNSI
jgi:hypothetical protein